MKFFCSFVRSFQTLHNTGTNATAPLSRDLRNLSRFPVQLKPKGAFWWTYQMLTPRMNVPSWYHEDNRSNILRGERLGMTEAWLYPCVLDRAAAVAPKAPATNTLKNWDTLSEEKTLSVLNFTAFTGGGCNQCGPRFRQSRSQVLQRTATQLPLQGTRTIYFYLDTKHVCWIPRIKFGSKFWFQFVLACLEQTMLCSFARQFASWATHNSHVSFLGLVPVFARSLDESIKEKNMSPF